MNELDILLHLPQQNLLFLKQKYLHVVQQTKVSFCRGLQEGGHSLSLLPSLTPSISSISGLIFSSNFIASTRSLNSVETRYLLYAPAISNVSLNARSMHKSSLYKSAISYTNGNGLPE